MNFRRANFKDGKRELHSIPKKGQSMNTCATLNEKYLCCRVHVLKSVHNCPFECTYCFLQNYLTDGATKIVEDIHTLMSEVRERISQEPERLFRVGTWELGDSLALEQESGQAAQLVQEFSKLGNAVLELKTKSDCVASLLHLKHNEKTVVSWSLNTEQVIAAEEHGTASLTERLESIRKVSLAGYLIGLHFDPMIFYKGWEGDYESLVRQVFETVSPERVAWISVGSLRFNPEMRKKIENNYPDSRLTCAEMVQGDDAKMRYVKPLRVSMYKHLYHELKKYISHENLVYLCMERWDVWERIFGYHPDSAGHLDYLFARSLHERYGIGNRKPEIKIYNNIRTQNNKLQKTNIK